MSGGKVLLLFLALGCVQQAAARQYWLSPSGSDANNGLSLQTAWLSPNAAFGKLAAGDTLWVKGGTYTVGSTVKASNPGTKTLPVKVWAVRGEKPLFDCSSMRHYGSESSTYRGMDLRQAYWHVRGITIYKAGYNGVIIAGENITLEGMTVQECGFDGISMAAGAVNARILNCDSFRNCDTSAGGENGDGFAAKEGTGTVFIGCRAWENADDGWDVYGGNQPILVDSCWSWGNGVNYWPDYVPSYQGDGNGFKLGGGGGVDGNAPNVVLHSFAFNNVGKGFDQNHNAWGVTCIHCTGYNNNGMGNFAFQETPLQGKHVMINNLSFGGTGQNIAVGSTETTNSWNLGLSIANDQFESLNTADAYLSRDDDYRLTNPVFLALFRLKANHPALNCGTVQTYIRLKPYFAVPYSGSKPDLGAREFDQGSWTFPTPDETQPVDTSGTTPSGNRPAGTKQTIVQVSSTFSIAAGAKSVVWGPFCLSSAESAVFDFQPVGSSSGAAVVEFSKDNQTWTQVGAQVKNGSTSWATGKTVDLSAESTPWGPVVYIRFNNNSTKDVNIKNLVITATLYTSTALELPSAKSILVSDRYYNVHGQPALPTQKGLLLRRMVYSNGATVVQKRFNE
jgi:hypothetical protein